MQTLRTFALLTSGLIAVHASATELVRFSPQPISAIPPGTKFTAGPPSEWTHLISFVRGKLSTGDVDAVSETVTYYADLFNLVMLADVDTDSDGKSTLRDVAVGFSMQINGVNTVVTSDTQANLGGGLSLIGRSVLDGNIESLKNVRQLARTTNSMLIDAPAVMLMDGKHREMTVRYFVWVFPNNGNLGTAVWLVDPATTSSAVVDQPVQLLPSNMMENRAMNVKKENFNLLGIPNKDAFALVQLPQGTPFQLTDKFREVGGLATYDAETFAKLTTAITGLLKQ